MRIALIPIVVMVLVHCSEDPKRQQQRDLLRVPTPTQRVRRPVKKADTLYDPNGNLLPSEFEFAGLMLPRGLTLKRKTAYHHYYETTVPPSKLHFYFGSRVITGKIRRMSGTTTYVAARSRNASDESIRMDISIIPSLKEKGKHRVELRQLLPRKRNPPARKLIEEINQKRHLAQ